MRGTRRTATAVAIIAAGGLGFWSSDALGIEIPDPPLTLPTTLPPVTLPTLTTPKPPVEAPKPPVTEPAVPSPSPPQGGTGGSAPAESAPSSGNGGSSSSPGSPAAQQGTARPVRIRRVRVKRPWIARGGPAAGRSTVIVFRLARPAVVEIVVVQVAPTCRVWGSLRVRGHAGINRIRFRGRVGGRILPNGTYRLHARANGSQQVAVVRLVISEHRPSRLRAELAASACPGLEDGASLAAVRGELDGRQDPNGDQEASSASGTDVREGGVLGAQAITGASEGEAPAGIRAGLLLALALAAALLALVALPSAAIPNARVASIVVDRRLELGLAAGALLAAGTIVYALVA